MENRPVHTIASGGHGTWGNKHPRYPLVSPTSATAQIRNSRKNAYSRMIQQHNGNTNAMATYSRIST